MSSSSSPLLNKYTLNYFSKSWEIADPVIVKLRLLQLIACHSHMFEGSTRLKDTAILLMLFKMDCVHRQIENKPDISKTRIAGVFTFNILMHGLDILHSKYLVYITWNLEMIGRVFIKASINEKIKQIVCKWKDNRNKDSVPMILYAWKLDIKQIMFFQLCLYKCNKQNNTLTHQQKKAKHTNYFGKLPNEIISIISSYAIGHIEGIKLFLTS